MYVKTSIRFTLLLIQQIRLMKLCYEICSGPKIWIQYLLATMKWILYYLGNISVAQKEHLDDSQVSIKLHGVLSRQFHYVCVNCSKSKSIQYLLL